MSYRNWSLETRSSSCFVTQHKAAVSLRVGGPRIERCDAGPPLEQLPRAVVRVDDRLDEAQPVPCTGT